MPTQDELDNAVRKAHDKSAGRLFNNERHGLEVAAKQAGAFGKKAKEALEKDRKKKP